MKNTLNFENRAFDHIMVIQGGSNNLMCVGGVIKVKNRYDTRSKPVSNLKSLTLKCYAKHLLCYSTYLLKV